MISARDASENGKECRKTDNDCDNDNDNDNDNDCMLGSCLREAGYAGSSLVDPETRRHQLEQEYAQTSQPALGICANFCFVKNGLS